MSSSTISTKNLINPCNDFVSLNKIKEEVDIVVDGDHGQSAHSNNYSVENSLLSHTKKQKEESLSSVVAAEENGRDRKKVEESTAAVEESARERLKRHRVEMAGRVWIPDIWGQEDLLKDWIDCTTFDASLVNNTIMSARAALMQPRSPPANHLLRTRIENRC